MSQYQFFQFLSIEQPLTPAAKAELREISSRATITEDSFTNEYEGGDFNADPMQVLLDHFDLFLYTSNWGTYEFALKVPSRLFKGALEAYPKFGPMTIMEEGEHTLLRFILHHEGGDVTGSFRQSARWLERLSALRGDLMAGDRRLLYLGFLHAISRQEHAASALEPVLPDELDALTPPLRAFMEFMEIDPALLIIALERGASSGAEIPLNRWLEGLSVEIKDELLLRAIQGEEAAIGLELLAMHRAAQEAKAPARPRRTIGQILERYRTSGAVGAQRIEAEESVGDFDDDDEPFDSVAPSLNGAAEKAVARRRRRLDKAIARSGSGWAEVERLIQTRQPSSYKSAVTILMALKESGVDAAEMRARVTEIQEVHRRKKNFVQALRRAGLT